MRQSPRSLLLDAASRDKLHSFFDWNTVRIQCWDMKISVIPIPHGKDFFRDPEVGVRPAFGLLSLLSPLQYMTAGSIGYRQQVIFGYPVIPVTGNSKICKLRRRPKGYKMEQRG